MKKVDSRQQTAGGFPVCRILSTIYCLLFAVCCLLSTAVAQEPHEEKKPTNRLNIANQLDLRREFERLTELEKAGQWEDLITLYDKLARATAGKLVQRSDGAAGTLLRERLPEDRVPSGDAVGSALAGSECVTFVAATQLLREKMARLGAPARQVYRIMHDVAAKRAYAAAAAALDEKSLANMVAQYPLSSYTDDALSLLAALQAERGDFESAVISLKKLLSWCPDTGLEQERILARAAWYSYYADSPGQARSFLKMVHADDGIRIEKAARLHLPELSGRLRALARSGPSSGRRRYVDGIPGGGFDRVGVSSRVAAPDRIRWQGPLLGAEKTRRGFTLRARRRRSGRLRAITPGGGDYRYQSVVYDGKVYAGTEIGVSVFDLRTGKMVNALRAPGGGELFPGIDSSLTPTVTQNYVYANFVYKVSRSQDYHGILIKAAIPQYTLCAFDRQTGKLKWAVHESKEFKERFAGSWWSIPCAPVIHNGTLYAEVKTRKGLVVSRLAAFDARTGMMKWETQLCSNGTELTMFGDDARGPLSTSLALTGGARPTIYCCTNLGAIFALDARDGSVRWAVTYKEIPLKPAQGYYPQMRDIVWANSSPLVSDGVLVTAPLDSHNIYAFDASNGKKLWTFNYAAAQPPSGRSQFRYLLGVAGRKVIISGEKVAAVGLHSGKLKWATPGSGVISPTGRGLVCASEVVVPCIDGMYRFSLDSGKMLTPDRWILPRSPGGTDVERGNLLEADGRLIITGLTRVTVLENQMSGKR